MAVRYTFGHSLLTSRGSAAESCSEMTTNSAFVSCKRSLLTAVSATALAAILLFGNASISAAQQEDELNQLNKKVIELYKAKRYAEAFPIAQQVLAMWEKAFGPDHPKVASALSNLAGLYRSQDHYAEAEALYQRALTIEEKASGPDHPDVAFLLKQLAGLYVDQRRYTDAEALYQRALAIREKALGPDHPDVAVSLNNLG